MIISHSFDALRKRQHIQLPRRDPANGPPEVLFLTSYPPRVCGIATYSQDLVKALNQKFSHSFSVRICALESGEESFAYPPEVKYVLKTSLAAGYEELSLKINADNRIQIVLVQHEFGFFKHQGSAFLRFLFELSKPVVMVFHTVLPHPDSTLKSEIKSMAAACKSIVVMTHNSARILTTDYGLPPQPVSVIPHGTHLVLNLNKELLKIKYGLTGRKVLSTFGLLSSGKSIETTLAALPSIINTSPEVVFLVIGKTHPEVVKTEGEKYRERMEKMVDQGALRDHVKFINEYLALPDLLEYLQLTDIYLFTSNDPNQAVSGTFAYAMSCACPIISTPIPHAREVLTEDTGIIFDFGNSRQLADGVIRLLNDEPLRTSISSNTLQKIVSTAWENSAVAHAMLFEKMAGEKIRLRYNLPAINLDHLEKMTTQTGILQFSKINHPDPDSGYTLDDNARALVAISMYFRLTGETAILQDMRNYLGFIKRCQQPGGEFLNYLDKRENFTDQNNTTNLDDSNGRAVWALGYLISLSGHVPADLALEAVTILDRSLARIGLMQSPRAMAFAIKGLYYSCSIKKSPPHLSLMKTFADRLAEMYRQESNEKWDWFEGYITYANSILPEAMLYAWMLTGDKSFKDIARSTLEFLMSKTFNENGMEVVSNKNWLLKGQEPGGFGEQPIDVAYTIMTLSKFYDILRNEEYLRKMETAFTWFLGYNRLHQVVYNPCTGGCYDGLEETHVNLNQGAESTISYLMARLAVDKYWHDLK